MQPEQHLDPEADEADLGEQRQPVTDDEPDGDGRSLAGSLPIDAPEADLLEQAASLPVDDEDLPRG